MRFEPNLGQSEPSVRFLARAPGMTAFLVGDGVVLAPHAPGAAACDEPGSMALRFAGASADASVVGQGATGALSHYFRGVELGAAATSTPHFLAARYRGIYPGIDAVFYGAPGGLEYDLEIEPGADVHAVRLSFEGICGAELDARGDLVLESTGGRLVHHAPRVRQERSEGTATIPARYAMTARDGSSVTVALVLEGHDAASRTVVDPLLTFSTYLGGSDADAAAAVAVDAQGYIYVAGGTASSNFPVAAPYQAARAGGQDAFVTKLDPTGSVVIFSTYLGGSGNEKAKGIAVDGAGAIVLTGTTTSPDFPLRSALRPGFQGTSEAFITKLSPSGSALVFSTFFGGDAEDGLGAAAVDAQGNVSVVGSTRSEQIPGQQLCMYDRCQSAMYAKLDPAGQLVASRCWLGDCEQGHWVAFPVATDVVIDAAGDAHVVGNISTYHVSGDWYDAFYATMNPLSTSRRRGFCSGSYLTASPGGSIYAALNGCPGGTVTKVGGWIDVWSRDDVEVRSIASDAAGDIWVGGSTSSRALPVRSAIQGAYGGGSSDGFLARISREGATEVLSYVGGKLADDVAGVRVSGARVAIAGGSSSLDFPTLSALQGTFGGGGADAFVLGLDRGCDLDLAPGRLPDAATGLFYAETLAASGGTAPYSFSLAGGALPPGMTLSAGGTISGTPTTAGSYGFIVEATDAAGCAHRQAYSLAVCAARITIAPAALPPMTVGSGYSVQLAASGGTPPYQYSVAAGTIPPGLWLQTTGLISGTPTAGGSYVFTVEAWDAMGCSGLATYALEAPCQIQIDASGVPENPIQNTWATYRFRAVSGATPHTFQVRGVMPPDLSLAPDGRVSGFVGPAGIFPVDIDLVDVAGCSTSLPFTFSVCGIVRLAPSILPIARAGVPFQQPLTASDGIAPYTYALTNGPPWLSVTPGGLLQGTPPAPGVSSFSVRVTDGLGCDAYFSRDIVVNEASCPAIAIAPEDLPTGVVGAPYSVTFSASGGTGPYSFESAPLPPPGLLLSSSGVLSGAPSTSAPHTFTVRAQDARGCRGEARLVFTTAENVLLGLGPGEPNPNRVAALDPSLGRTATDFYAYGAGKWGTTVAGGDVELGALDEVLTGPGPGDVYGPTVKGFRPDGSPIAKISFFAYGTLRFGVNVTATDVDRDGWDEIVTGPGPGDVFGPHVRGFTYDGAGPLVSLSKINFFAFSTLRWGANVAGGDLDGDGFGELLASPGPGESFAPLVRGFDYDGVSVTTIAKVNFWAFTVYQYGAVPSAGDVERDGWDEIGASPGPGPTAAHPAQVRGFNVDGGAATALPGFDVVAFPTYYGARPALGDVTGDAVADLAVGPGRDPAAGARLRTYLYTGAALAPGAVANAPLGSAPYGVNVAIARLGVGP